MGCTNCFYQGVNMRTLCRFPLGLNLITLSPEIEQNRGDARPYHPVKSRTNAQTEFRLVLRKLIDPNIRALVRSIGIERKDRRPTSGREKPMSELPPCIRGMDPFYSCGLPFLAHRDLHKC